MHYKVRVLELEVVASYTCYFVAFSFGVGCLHWTGSPEVQRCLHVVCCTDLLTEDDEKEHFRKNIYLCPPAICSRRDYSWRLVLSLFWYFATVCCYLILCTWKGQDNTLPTIIETRDRWDGIFSWVITGFFIFFSIFQNWFCIGFDFGKYCDDGFFSCDLYSLFL